MISYIKGTLERRAESYIIIETGGIGYRIFVSPATLAKLPQTGAEAKVYTYFSVKEEQRSVVMVECYRNSVAKQGLGLAKMLVVKFTHISIRCKLFLPHFF